MTATDGVPKRSSSTSASASGLPFQSVSVSLVLVTMLAFSDPAQAAAVKKSVSSKSAQNFDLKRITAAAAQAPKHPQSGNHSLASVGASSLLHSTHEIEKQFQQLKRDGFRGNPSIELLERMTGEMHNQKRWADKELVMRAKCVAYEKHYGADHPVVACQLESMSEMYKKLNRLSDASKMQTRANSILKAARDNIDATPLYDVHPDGTISERSPMTHDDRIIDLRTRAEVFASHADYETSAAYLKKALAESKAEDGGFTPEDYRNLASFEERLGNDKEAARLRDAAETTY